QRSIIYIPFKMGQFPAYQKFLENFPIIIRSHALGKYPFKGLLGLNDPGLCSYGLYMVYAADRFKFRIKILVYGNRDHGNIGRIIVVIIDLDMPVKSRYLLPDLVL